MQILVLTSGNSQYFVDKNLSKLTKQNLFLNNVPCNIICLKDEVELKPPYLFFLREPPKKIIVNKG